MPVSIGLFIWSLCLMPKAAGKLAYAKEILKQIDESRN